MTKEQIQYILRDLGITDMNDAAAISEKIVSWIFDNNLIVHVYPPDELHQLLKIDWDNEMFIFLEGINSYAVKEYKPFDCLQQVNVISDYKFKTDENQRFFLPHKLNPETGEYEVQGKNPYANRPPKYPNADTIVIK